MSKHKLSKLLQNYLTDTKNRKVKKFLIEKISRVFAKIICKNSKKNHPIGMDDVTPMVNDYINKNKIVDDLFIIEENILTLDRLLKEMEQAEVCGTIILRHLIDINFYTIAKRRYEVAINHSVIPLASPDNYFKNFIFCGQNFLQTQSKKSITATINMAQRNNIGLQYFYRLFVARLLNLCDEYLTQYPDTNKSGDINTRKRFFDGSNSYYHPQLTKPQDVIGDVKEILQNPSHQDEEKLAKVKSLFLDDKHVSKIMNKYPWSMRLYHIIKNIFTLHWRNLTKLPRQVAAQEMKKCISIIPPIPNEIPPPTVVIKQWC